MARQEVFIQNGPSVYLSDTDHVATGGEGSLYIKGSHAYKIYLDPDRARQNGMIEKIDLLRKVKNPLLVTPEDLLMNQKNQLIGYRMPVVQGISLMEMFSNAWWDQNGYTTDDASKLVRKMREAMAAVHAHKALAVDANEMNWMVSGNEPRLIDCDSWKIDRFPATAIMPSIRDYSSNDFTNATDWFAWGVVSFQLFTGIHPYKGTHPNFKKGDLENRMKQKVSVFDKDVRLAASVRPMDSIPSALRDWYYQTFQEGLRELPPENFAAAVKAARVRKQAAMVSGKVQKTIWWETSGQILDFTDTGFVFYKDGGKFSIFDLAAFKVLPNVDATLENQLKTKKASIIRQGSDVLIVSIDQGKISAKNIMTGKVGMALPTNAMSLLTIGNRVYALNPEVQNGLQELTLLPTANAWAIGIRASWPILVRSSRFYGSVIWMDCLGTPFLMVAEEKSHIPVRASILKDYQVVDAISSDSSLVFVVVLEKKTGDMKLLVLKKEQGEMQLETSFSLDARPALTSLSSGVLVAIPEDGKLFMASGKSPQGKWVENTGLDADIQLRGMDSGLVGREGNKIFKLKMS